MKQEQKELLLKDISARLPYNVKCTYYDKCVNEEDKGTITGMQNGTYFVIDGVCIDVENVKPYLFPLSSMTEEQRKEYDSIIYHNIELHVDRYYEVIDVDSFELLRDFYHKNHLDYGGLILVGLAKDATNLNIY